MNKIELWGIAVHDLKASNALFEKLLGVHIIRRKEVALRGENVLFKAGPIN